MFTKARKGGVFRISTRGYESMPEGPRFGHESRLEGPRAGWVGFMGRSATPHYQPEGIGKRCKLPELGPGQSPGRQMVLPYFKHSG